jgi:hypothetical protein
MIPTHLLKPEDMHAEIDGWIKDATDELKPTDDIAALEQFLEMKKQVSDRIMELRSTVKNYNLPYLSLPAQTDKTVALNVFINMNTNSKPLSTYDIIVAEVESVMGKSLHDLVDGLEEAYPTVSRYSELPGLILTTASLLQGHPPSQRGAWEMDKAKMVQHWDQMGLGLKRMAEFLRGEGIYDAHRLPTNAVLAPIAALYAADIAESGDKRGQDELLLKKYLWHAFFSDRYENAASSHAYSDFVALRRLVRGEPKPDGSEQTVEAIPIFAEHPLAEVEELMAADWPKKATIRGRAILAVTCRMGSHDFATGEPLGPANVETRHYHHIFPDALLKEAGIESFRAVNCALIADKTNISIGRKDPLVYLKDRYKWTSEVIVRERLQSHLIPIDELANGGYEGLGEQEKIAKIKTDFDAFRRRRAEMVHKAMVSLTEGRQLSASEIYGG